MKNLLYIALFAVVSVVMLSCKDNKTCRQEIFGDQVWHGPFNQYEEMYFRPDDTLEWKAQAAQNWSTKSTYDFDDDCSGFIWYMGAPGNAHYHYSISIIHSDTVKLTMDGNPNGFILHK